MAAYAGDILAGEQNVNQKKAKIIIGVSLGIALAAMIALVVVIVTQNSGKKPKTPASDPKETGTVKVWRVTAIYLKQGDNPRYCYETNTIDALGRYETQTRYNLNGETENVIRFSYDAETKRTDMVDRFYSDGKADFGTDRSYDPEGRELAYVLYTSREDGLVKENEETRTFDEDGNLLTEYLIFYFENGTSEFRKDYDPETMTYIRTAREDDGPFQKSGIEELDAQRRVVREFRYYEKDGERLTKSYEYREDGSRTVTEYYGAADGTKITEYDAKDRILKEAYCEPDGTESSCQVHEYSSDESGSREKVTYYVEGEMRQWFEYVYNSQGDQTAYTEGGTIGSQTTYIDVRYDEQGRILSKTCDPEQPGSIASFHAEYEYDSHGNLIRHTLEGDGRVTEIWEYEYTPYELTEEQAAEADKYYNAKEINGPVQ